MFCIFLDAEVPCHVIFFSEALYRRHETYAFFCFFHFADDMGVCVFGVCPTTPMSSAGTKIVIANNCTMFIDQMVFSIIRVSQESFKALKGSYPIIFHPSISRTSSGSSHLGAGPLPTTTSKIFLPWPTPQLMLTFQPWFDHVSPPTSRNSWTPNGNGHECMSFSQNTLNYANAGKSHQTYH